MCKIYVLSISAESWAMFFSLSHNLEFSVIMPDSSISQYDGMWNQTWNFLWIAGVFSLVVPHCAICQCDGMWDQQRNIPPPPYMIQTQGSHLLYGSQASQDLITNQFILNAPNNFSYLTVELCLGQGLRHCLKIQTKCHPAKHWHTSVLQHSPYCGNLTDKQLVQYGQLLLFSSPACYRWTDRLSVLYL